MTKKKRTLIAAAAAVVLVGIARGLLATGSDIGVYCAIGFLFPGMVINLLTHGVHGGVNGSLDTPLGEVVTVGVPAIGWFFIFRALLGALGVEEKPNQSPQPTARQAAAADHKR